MSDNWLDQQEKLMKRIEMDEYFASIGQNDNTGGGGLFGWIIGIVIAIILALTGLG